MKQGWRKLFIRNRRGQMLAALLCEADAVGGCGRARSESGQSLSSPPLVVVSHGFTGSKEGGGRALEMGEALARRGYHALLFDFAGCGESEGQWEEITLTRHIEDLSDVVSWCEAQGYEQIILNGRSFGGAAALCCAARDGRVVAVCTWAAPAGLVELFNGFTGEAVTGTPGELVALAGAGGSVKLRRAFFYDLPRHNILSCAARISPRPLLVIHGGADETVPPASAEAIYTAAGEPKQLAVIDGADHRFSGHITQVWGLFFRWLDQPGLLSEQY